MTDSLVRPTLFLMCGLPFAGKSTAARRLASGFEAEIVELDAINSELGIGLDGMPITQPQWLRSYDEAFSRLRASLSAGRAVIFDAANYTRHQRDILRELAAEAHAETVVIYVPLSLAQARRRWLANRRSRSRGDVRDEDFATVADNFEPPEDDEASLIINAPWEQ